MRSRNTKMHYQSVPKNIKSNTTDRKKYIKIRSINTNTKYNKISLFQLAQKKLIQTRLEVFRFFIGKYFNNVYNKYYLLNRLRKILFH